MVEAVQPLLHLQPVCLGGSHIRGVQVHLYEHFHEPVELALYETRQTRRNRETKNMRTPAIFSSFLHRSSHARSAGGPNLPPAAAAAAAFFPFSLAGVRVRPTRPPPWDTTSELKPSDIKAAWPSSIARSLRSRRSSKASAGSSTVNSATEGCARTYS